MFFAFLFCYGHGFGVCALCVYAVYMFFIYVHFLCMHMCMYVYMCIYIYVCMCEKLTAQCEGCSVQFVWGHTRRVQQGRWGLFFQAFGETEPRSTTYRSVFSDWKQSAVGVKQKRVGSFPSPREWNLQPKAHLQYEKHGSPV